MNKQASVANLNESVAEQLFGWRWVSYVGIPVRDTPDYPTEQRVRRFFPPSSLGDPAWIDYFAKKQAKPSTGDEPLDYAYCSSCGPARVPCYTGNANDWRDMEREIRKRGLWKRYREALLAQEHDMDDDEYLSFADGIARCSAALAVIA